MKTIKHKKFIKKKRKLEREKNKERKVRKILRKKITKKQVLLKAKFELKIFQGKKKPTFRTTPREKRIEIPNDKAHKPGEVISYFA